MKDLLTIVIPCKNEEKYIVPLLEDLSQQYGISDVRIIIADAGFGDCEYKELWNGLESVILLWCIQYH